VSRRLLLVLLVGIPVVALAGVLSWSFLRTPTLPELLPPPVSALLPDLAMSPVTDISAVLGHAGPSAGEKHYNRARMLDAGERHQARMSERRKAKS